MKKRSFHASVLLGVILCIFSSCRPLKDLNYFQKGKDQTEVLTVEQPYKSVIQTGDLLSINVSSLDATASSYFNPFTRGAATGSSGDAIGSSENAGYLVDIDGNIELPLIGSFKISGLTTAQLRDTLKSKLSFYLKEPRVFVRIINYKITLMGEVSKPAVYNIPNQQVTITEVLSMAGDLTPYGRRDNIMVIREHDGKKEIGRVNLGDRSVFSSPYYYLRANDLIYVEPVPAKGVQSSTFFRVLPITLSIISIVITLFLRVL